jgi:hypothetical protein
LVVYQQTLINYSHINFCCIYTRTTRFHKIANQIETYFSGLSSLDYEEIKKVYAHISDAESDKIQNFLISKKYDNLDILLEDIGVDLNIHPELLTGKTTDAILLLKYIYNAFQLNVKPQKIEKELTSNHFGGSCFISNKTIIILLSKDDDNDPKPSFLLSRIRDEILHNKNSFIQLLGLEMQTIFNSNESFIDENILSSSTEALFTHRTYLKDKNKSDVPFSSLIKNVLIEHASLRLRTSKLSLLETSFLDTESAKYSKVPSQEEVASLNTFYNSVNITSLNNRDFPKVNFGDVFVDKEKNYYLCITALCDCLRPEKIKQNYYFVKGKAIEIELANSLGDSAFISYFSDKLSVSWITLESAKPKKADNTGLTAEQSQINNLKAENEALKQFKFKPVYIEPNSFNVKIPTIINGKIEVRRVESIKEIIAEDNGTINFITLNYVSTLRPNYTQRIANHSFTHPVRVGVDFIKI